jgi:tetratricopeptide (TPR) repeat protein
VAHKKFKVLDDLQTTGLYASDVARLDLCEVAVKLAPDLSIVQMSLFEGLAAQGRWHDAQSRLSAIARVDPDGSTSYLARGEVAAHAGKLQEGAELMRRAVELAPEVGSAHFVLAEVYLLIGNLAAARQQYQEGLRNAYYGRTVAAAQGMLAFIDASVCQARGDWHGVVSNAQKAIEFRPDYAPAFFCRAAGEYFTGDLASAAADYEKAARLDPHRSEPLKMLGYVLYECHDYSGSLAAFRKVSALEPADDYTRFRIWLNRSRLGEAGATAELKTYLDSRPYGSADDWPAKVGAFVVGKMPEAEFLRAAAPGGKEKEALRRCEALFYAGAKRLLAGDNDAALTYFEQCVANGDKTSTDYWSAASELRLLRPDKPDKRAGH